MRLILLNAYRLFHQTTSRWLAILGFLISSVFGGHAAAETPPPFYPISVSSCYVNVSPTRFHDPEEFEDQKIGYRQADTAFAFTHPVTPIWGLIVGGGWVGTEIKWEENPSFTQTEFNYVNFSAGIFSKAFLDWTWTLTTSLFIDTEVLDISDYALYQGILMGQYVYNKCLEFDFGFILEIGLRDEKIWPICGFIYSPYASWRFSCIFPIKIAVEYKLHPAWTLGGSIRFLRNRHRVKDTEPIPKAIFEYRDTGIEFDLNFVPLCWASVRGFVGSTFAGDLKIAEMNGKHATHFKFDGSFYGGISGIISF